MCMIQNTLLSSFNPLPALFKALLHGQKDRVFFSWHLIYILKHERFRAVGPAKGQPFGAERPIYGSYHTANLQMLHFKYLFNKYPY
jgi:hypothetical protein